VSVDAMTQQFSHSIVAIMDGKVVKLGYLMQGEIFIACNFVNTYHRQLSCIYLLPVHHNESTNMLIRLFSDLVFN